MDVPTQSDPVSPPPITNTRFPCAEIRSFCGICAPAFTRFCCCNSSSAKYTPFRSRPSTGRSRGTPAPIVTQTASNFSSNSLVLKSLPTQTEGLNSIPSSASSFNLRSIIFLPSLKSGIPNRNSPPINSFFSNTVTRCPRRFSLFAQASPEGPDPTTATRFPVRLRGGRAVTYPSAKARSTIDTSFSRIVTGASCSFSTQDFSHNAGHTRPVNSGKSSVSASER